MKVQEIMTREVVTVDPDAELRDVARILVDKNISGVPVCGARGELVGIVSEGDILVKEGGPRDERGFFGWLRGADVKRAQKVRALKARDAMTAQVLTISPYASVAEAARRMSDLGIKRLPVVKDGRLVGIVSRTDLMRAFVRSDDEIRREIQEDLLRRTLWLEVPEAVAGAGRARCRSPERPGRNCDGRGCPAEARCSGAGSGVGERRAQLEVRRCREGTTRVRASPAHFTEVDLLERLSTAPPARSTRRRASLATRAGAVLPRSRSGRGRHGSRGSASA